MRHDIDDIFRRFLSRFPSLGGEAFEDGMFHPRVDVSETKDKIAVKAEVPGMEAKDIEVALSGNKLTIKGEKKSEKEEKDEIFSRVERYYGSFSRTVELPSEVIAEKITANYKNGILTINLPKSEEAGKDQVKIKVSS